MKGKMSLISPDAIRNHLANTSPAKVSHSFTRSRRFSPANPECKQAFYSHHSSSLSKIQSTIGNSKRSDFTKSTVLSPAPNTYQPDQGTFTTRNNSFTFGCSRDRAPSASYLYRFRKGRVPGPGNYQNQVKTRSNISFTARAKTLDVVAKNLSFLDTPGPGNYQSLDLNPRNGRQKVSRFNDAKLSVIGSGKRFRDRKITPGPSDYIHPDNFSSKGKYVLSQRRGKGTRPFDMEKKFTVGYWKINDNPAPGQYQKPSDFGVYGDSTYYKSVKV